MRRLHRKKSEPELTVQPMADDESDLAVGPVLGGLHPTFTTGGRRRAVRDAEPRLDLDAAPIAALFDDPEDL